MPRIDTLWIGMKTAVGSDTGTDSSIVLIINEGGDPVDAVTFHSSGYGPKRYRKQDRPTFIRSTCTTKPHTKVARSTQRS